MNMKRNKKGVTLLEMILVIMLISIAAALAMPNMQKGVDQKRADNAIATMRMMSYCLRLYLQEHGDVLPANTAWGHLDTENAAGIDGNGCFDRNQMENTFTFPARDTLIPNPPPVTLVATDKKSTRTVCLVPAGTRDRSGNIYDLPSGTCIPEPANGWYRKFAE